MKKIIWLIILIPIFILKVNASEIYYTEYGSFSEFQEDLPISSDLINIEEETRYLWYKNVQTLGDYKLYNDLDAFSSECYETDYSDWRDSSYVETPGRIYETRTRYEYESIQGIRYIHLYNLYGSYGAFRIPELSIAVDGMDISYNYECEGCWPDFEKYINNNIYIENKSYIDNGGYLILDLGEVYPIDKIKVLFYIFDLGQDDKKFTIGYSLDKNVLFYKDYTLKFSDEYWKNSQKIELSAQDIEPDNSKWLTNKITYQKQQSDLMRLLSQTKEYRYKEKWCKTHLDTKIYGNNYSIEPYDDFIYRDDTKSKTFYRFQKRNKIEVNIYGINRKDFDLNDFVVFSSAPYQIDNNINWDENGIYDLNFKIDDLVISKEISLNIEENTINNLEAKINQLNEIIINLENEFAKQKEEYKKQILVLENEIQKLEKELEKCQNDCAYEKSCLEEIINNNKKQLDEYEEGLLQLSNQINNSQIEIENKKAEIEKLKAKNNESLEEINKLESKLKDLTDKNAGLNKLIAEEYTKKIEELHSLNIRYENMLYKLQKDLEDIKSENDTNKQTNIEYQNKIERLEKLNKIYENKILELEEDLRQVNISINIVTKQKDNLINKYKEEIAFLNQEIDGTKEIKDKYEELVINYNNEREEKALINSKYNDYILKIKSDNIKLVGLWFCLLVIVLIMYFIYRIVRKKSNEKKV